MKNINLKKGNQKGVGDLKNPLDFALADVEGLKNQLARALADYDNLRKRTDRERELWARIASERVLTKLLPVLDTLEMANKHLKDQGLQMAIDEFTQVLRDEEIEEIDTKGKFDASIHEAVENVSGGEKNKIADVILKGWKNVNGPVIRHAKVRVYNGADN